MKDGTLRVSVGGLDFFGHRGPLAIEKEGFTGWDGLSYRTDSPARTNAHGALDAAVFMEPRTVSLKGYAVAERPEELDRIRSLFFTCLGENRDSTVVVQRPWGTRWAPNARLVERKFDEVGGHPYAKFLLTVRFADALKYGERHSFSMSVGSSVWVSQFGSEPAWPVVTVTGNMPAGYTLTMRGQQVSVPGGIFTGQTHRIEYRKRRIYINGEFFMGMFGNSNFPTVLPGVRQSCSLSAPSGSGSAVIEVADTFT